MLNPAGTRWSQVLRRLDGPLSLDELDDMGEVHAPWRHHGGTKVQNGGLMVMSG